MLENNNQLTLLDTTNHFSVTLPCDLTPAFKGYKVTSKKYDYFTEYNIPLQKETIEYQVKQGRDHESLLIVPLSVTFSISAI